jgi:dTDP-4-dehydrorhamnose reductase
MKILVLGDGKLGTEIVRQTGWKYISRKKDGFDITDPNCYVKHLLKVSDSIEAKKKYDVVVNCIANTDTYSTDKQAMFETNFEAVADLSDFCKMYDIKLIHISTDYVYAGSVNKATEEDRAVPSENWYTYYKLLADEYVSFTNDTALMCRCSFKSRPFEFKYAWVDQMGNFDYIDVIADLIIKLINKKAKGIYNVGTNLKTIYDLAKQTNSEIKPSRKPEQAPANISMNIDKLNNLLNENTSNNTKP